MKELRKTEKALNMPKGGARPGAGRKGGSLRARKVEQELTAMMEHSRLTPLQFLVRTYNDPREPKQLRLAAAIAAAPFLHPRLSALTVPMPTQMDENGIPIIDISNNSSASNITTINIVPIESGRYLEGNKKENASASVSEDVGA